ncbi:MAG TPA: hypothetical protein VNI83_00440 [Vicinamibacterales bacterium]|nr:hypothetical protein [Vicinamibacterales bacterium]
MSAARAGSRPSVTVEAAGAGARTLRHRDVLVLPAFAVLAALHTWPLVLAPATYSRHDNADAMLNQWVLAWVAHQLPRDPLRLFHANIFYPERNTLAFSEHMIVQGVMGLPLFLLGASSLLVHNLVLLAGFALTGWAMYVVVRRWTADRAAAFVAGCAAAFNAHSFSRLAHLQALHVEFLPFAVYWLDRTLERPSMRSAVLLGLTFALQGLTSNYWLVFTTLGLIAAGLARPRDWWGARARAVVPALAVAAAVALLLVVPFLVPYYRVMTEQGLIRTLDDVALYSGGWRDYLSTGSPLHFRLWSWRAWGSGGLTPLFPGVVVTLLAVTGIAAGVRTAHVRMWVAVAAAGVLVSLGTNLPGYAVLYRVFPLMQGIRAPVRAGHLALVALAALAGFGLAWVRRRWPGRRARLVALAALGAVSLEAWRGPIAYTPATEPPRVYDLLARERRAVVVEFPFPEPRAWFENAPYMLNSTRHWRPMLNGYSGFLPASYVRHWERLRSFPAPEALAALRDTGVTHVVVHHGAPEMAGFVPPPNHVLEPLASTGELTIYRLRWERVPGGP